mgnify:CR=1 FL=1
MSSWLPSFGSATSSGSPAGASNTQMISEPPIEITDNASTITTGGSVDSSGFGGGTFSDSFGSDGSADTKSDGGNKNSWW